MSKLSKSKTLNWKVTRTNYKWRLVTKTSSIEIPLGTCRAMPRTQLVKSTWVENSSPRLSKMLRRNSKRNSQPKKRGTMNSSRSRELSSDGVSRSRMWQRTTLGWMNQPQRFYWDLLQCLLTKMMMIRSLGHSKLRSIDLEKRIITLREIFRNLSTGSRLLEKIRLHGKWNRSIPARWEMRPRKILELLSLRTELVSYRTN